jgi:hypothetical protein
VRLRHGQPAVQRRRRGHQEGGRPGRASDGGRLPFGLPGTNAKTGAISNANSLWIQYFYAYLNDTGRAGFVMASSASDAGNKDRDIREKLVKTGHVDVMMAIGNKFFYTRSLPCTLWFFDKGKPRKRRKNAKRQTVRRLGKQTGARPAPRPGPRRRRLAQGPRRPADAPRRRAGDAENRPALHRPEPLATAPLPGSPLRRRRRAVQIGDAGGD